MEYCFYYEDCLIFVFSEFLLLYMVGYQFNVNMFLQYVKWNCIELVREYLKEYVFILGCDYIVDVFEIKFFLGNLIFNVMIIFVDMDV